ncbi:molybdate transport system regulatory protein [Azospirillum fermentarium]|uniref:winged helix-turn-helix domain-containing protein n=1 Tax=Azospirillum fermentarium TaxID=1233114 RepID=UPI0029CAB918|nr:winged helix-turn-helix domain-containing protein [Azospirillum fermentarium]MCW2247216.1 molybdate transport system regulatory protein [Azospirillum fermentarium]
MTRLRLRIDFRPDGAIGPGKIRLLEAIREEGSISAAARALDMSYRRAWLLVDDLNRLFREPVVSAAVGGRHGGGTELTAFGAALIEEYRAIERDIFAAARPRLVALEAALAPEGSRPAATPGTDESFGKDPALTPGCAAGLKSLSRAVGGPATCSGPGPGGAGAAAAPADGAPRKRRGRPPRVRPAEVP